MPTFMHGSRYAAEHSLLICINRNYCMFIFQFKPLGVETKEEPKYAKIWSIHVIQKLVGADCPEAVAKAILKTTEVNKIQEKTEQVKQALTESHNHPGISQILQNNRMAELFVRSPHSFVKIAAAGGAQCLKDDKIAVLFVRYPDQFAELAPILKDPAEVNCLKEDRIAALFIKNPDGFVQIAKYELCNYGNISYLFDCLILRYPKIAAFFEKYPQQCAKLAMAGRQFTCDILPSLQDDRIAAILIKYPDQFVEIVKATGYSTRHFFEILINNNVDFDRFSARLVELAKKVDDDPLIEFVFKNEKLAKAFTEHPDLVITAIVKLRDCDKIYQPIGKWDLQILADKENIKKTIAEMTEEDRKFKQQISGALDSLPQTPEDSLCVNVLVAAVIPGNYVRAVRLAKSLGARYTDPAVCLNFSYALQIIGEEKIKVLYKKAGIEYFARYPKKVLDEVYQNLDPAYNAEKPILLVAGSKNDWVGISYLGGQLLGALTKYYKLMLVEVDSNGGFYNAVKKIGGGNVDGKPRKIDSLLMAGHGMSDYIILGTDAKTGKLKGYRQSRAAKVKKFFRR